MTLVKRTNDDFSRILESFLGSNEMFPRTGRANSMPAINIMEGINEFKLEVAAPGLQKDDFKINVEKDVLTISASKEVKKDDKGDTYIRSEFFYNTFSRSFNLSDAINQLEIQANYKDGILTIVLPKKEEAKELPAREIGIN